MADNSKERDKVLLKMLKTRASPKPTKPKPKVDNARRSVRSQKLKSG